MSSPPSSRGFSSGGGRLAPTPPAAFSHDQPNWASDLRWNVEAVKCSFFRLRQSQHRFEAQADHAKKKQLLRILQKSHRQVDAVLESAATRCRQALHHDGPLLGENDGDQGLGGAKTNFPRPGSSSSGTSSASTSSARRFPGGQKIGGANARPSRPGAWTASGTADAERRIGGGEKERTRAPEHEQSAALDPGGLLRMMAPPMCPGGRRKPPPDLGLRGAFHGGPRPLSAEETKVGNLQAESRLLMLLPAPAGAFDPVIGVEAAVRSTGGDACAVVPPPRSSCPPVVPPDFRDYRDELPQAGFISPRPSTGRTTGRKGKSRLLPRRPVSAQERSARVFCRGGARRRVADTSTMYTKEVLPAESRTSGEEKEIFVQTSSPLQIRGDLSCFSFPGVNRDRWARKIAVAELCAKRERSLSRGSRSKDGGRPQTMQSLLTSFSISNDLDLDQYASSLRAEGGQAGIPNMGNSSSNSRYSLHDPASPLGGRGARSPEVVVPPTVCSLEENNHEQENDLNSFISQEDEHLPPPPEDEHFPPPPEDDHFPPPPGEEHFPPPPEGHRWPPAGEQFPPPPREQFPAPPREQFPTLLQEEDVEFVGVSGGELQLPGGSDPGQNFATKELLLAAVYARAVRAAQAAPGRELQAFSNVSEMPVVPGEDQELPANAIASLVRETTTARPTTSPSSRSAAARTYTPFQLRKGFWCGDGHQAPREMNSLPNGRQAEIMSPFLLQGQGVQDRSRLGGDVGRQACGNIPSRPRSRPPPEPTLHTYTLRSRARVLAAVEAGRLATGREEQLATPDFAVESRKAEIRQPRSQHRGPTTRPPLPKKTVLVQESASRGSLLFAAPSRSSPPRPRSPARPHEDSPPTVATSVQPIKRFTDKRPKSAAAKLFQECGPKSANGSPSPSRPSSPFTNSRIPGAFFPDSGEVAVESSSSVERNCPKKNFPVVLPRRPATAGDFRRRPQNEQRVLQDLDPLLLHHGEKVEPSNRAASSSDTCMLSENVSSCTSAHSAAEASAANDAFWQKLLQRSARAGGDQTSDRTSAAARTHESESSRPTTNGLCTGNRAPFVVGLLAPETSRQSQDARQSRPTTPRVWTTFAAGFAIPPPQSCSKVPRNSRTLDEAGDSSTIAPTVTKLVPTPREKTGEELPRGGSASKTPRTVKTREDTQQQLRTATSRSRNKSSETGSIHLGNKSKAANRAESRPGSKASDHPTIAGREVGVPVPVTAASATFPSATKGGCSVDTTQHRTKTYGVGQTQQYGPRKQATYRLRLSLHAEQQKKQKKLYETAMCGRTMDISLLLERAARKDKVVIQKSDAVQEELIIDRAEVFSVLEDEEDKLYWEEDRCLGRKNC